MKFLSVILLLAFCVMNTNVKAQDPAPDNSLVIASFSFPPLLHLADNGTFSGTMGETVRFICEEAKLDCTFKLVPLKRAYNDLRHGRVDGLITLDLGQFKECCFSSKWFSEWSAGLFSTHEPAKIPSTREEILGGSLIVVNGMRSPYSFLPDMDQLAKEKSIRLYKVKNISTAVKMFAVDRADFLWGGEDFKWYLQRIAPNKQYHYKPLFKKNVVLWTQKVKSLPLMRFNKAYTALKNKQALSQNGLMIPYFMDKRYKEYSMPETMD
ncbi:transporter substrate-binding domain-containing protein [Terasakiella sp. SH-1]|uniref:transporter substrate-binding domain-containing protein n=1 Tax=Terasakiella sp. SH-1 TaxID=2560057 RepID=UPI001072FC91|nr:transporter substrate-binding domain-containing protein [Terasakiella sp. SH-1]